jgi:hypothetical protein
MEPTIAELEQLLTGRGFNCRRVGDDVLSINIPTKAYRNTKGKRHIDVCVRLDSQHNCLVMESHWAFDMRKTTHQQAVIDCLLGAASLTPLIRPQHDPRQGEVKLRVDTLIGTGGISTDNVVTLLGTIPAFADGWYPQITSAMLNGTYDLSTPCETAVRDHQLADIARRAGGINRLRVLLSMQHRRRPDIGPSLN